MALFEDKWEKMKLRQSRSRSKTKISEESESSATSVKQAKTKPRKYWGMTVHIEKEYFWGKAGLLRVVTLMVSIIAMCLGFPGFQGSGQVHELYVGYGDSFFVQASIALNFTSIVIAYIVILMLLIFVDVRCKPEWEYRNMLTCVAQCCLMVSAGLCQFLGTRQTRISNCQINGTADCRSDLNMPYPIPTIHLASSYRPPYYLFQYAAAYAKIGTSMMYCVCGRICLRNDDSQ